MNDGSIDNAMGMTSLDIIESRKLNKNGNLRYDLQKKVGPLSASSDNQSVVTIRKRNIKKRKRSPLNANFHLPLSSNNYITPMWLKCDDISIVTPVDTNDNSRWYNGGLSYNPIAIEDRLSTPIKYKSAIETNDPRKSIIKD